MIDKINGNDIYGFTDQKKRKNPAVKAYENTPGQKEAAGQKTSGKRSADSRNASKQGNQGVILDLSGNAAKERAKAVKSENSFSVSSALRKLFTPIVRWLKDFWNSEASAKAPADDGMGAEAAEKMKESADLSALEAHNAVELSASEEQNTAGLASEEQNTAGLASEVQGAAVQTDALERGQGAAGLTASEEQNSAELLLETDASDLTADSQVNEAGMASVTGGASAAVSLTQETQRAYEILKERQTEQDSEGLPPLEDIEELPRYGAISDEAIKSGNLQQIEQLLTRNGARQLAHNSDLLTYYDRFGRLIELDETERHRVLFGDKNVMKL